MKRPILLGGNHPPRCTTMQFWLLSTWLPVVVMLAAITIESTHLFSSNHTSGWMRFAYQAVAGRVSDAAWIHIHHIIRKTGHFTGYGLLGVSWMRAWLIVWWQPLGRRFPLAWRGYSFLMAILCTALVAGLDELHQSFMPDRTGVVSDVLLDTAGAFAMLVLCLVIAAAWNSKSRSVSRTAR